MATRRQFLISALGSILASGTVMNITKAALADPVTGRYAMVIKLQESLYSHNRELRAEREAYRLANPKEPYWPKDVRVEKHQPITEKADVLFQYMMENFDGERTDEAYYQVTDLFERRINVDTMSMEGLQKLMEVVVPIAIAKRVLSVERCPIDTQKMVWFAAFADKYREMILIGKHRPEKQTVAMYPEWAIKNGYTPQKIAAIQAEVATGLA